MYFGHDYIFEPHTFLLVVLKDQLVYSLVDTSHQLFPLELISRLNRRVQDSVYLRLLKYSLLQAR